ncbi:MAG: SufE family protein [Planctomycetota bacterium]
MSSQFPPAMDDLVEEFEELEDWDERYDLLIDLGRELPEFPADLQTAENVVKGCMSTVWLVTTTSQDTETNQQHIHIQADSDSIIVKGLIVVLLSFFDGHTAEDIIRHDAEEYFGKLGLNQHLSPQRRNGLFSMVKRLKELAVQFASNSDR